MKTTQSESKWWLGAIIAPVFSTGVGVLIALGSPLSQSDWLGMGLIRPILLALLFGCILSVILSIISLSLRERHSLIGCLISAPALCMILYAAAIFAKSQKDSKNQAERNAQHYRNEDRKFMLIKKWTDEFRANPDLITDEDFWNKQIDSEQIARWGLVGLLQDTSFNITPEIKRFVIGNFPDDYVHLSRRNILTKSDLQTIMKNPKCGFYTNQFAEQSLKEGRYLDSEQSN